MEDYLIWCNFLGPSNWRIHWSRFSLNWRFAEAASKNWETDGSFLKVSIINSKSKLRFSCLFFFAKNLNNIFNLWHERSLAPGKIMKCFSWEYSKAAKIGISIRTFRTQIWIFKIRTVTFRWYCSFSLNSIVFLAPTLTHALFCHRWPVTIRWYCQVHSWFHAVKDLAGNLGVIRKCSIWLRIRFQFLDFCDFCHNFNFSVLLTARDGISNGEWRRIRSRLSWDFFRHCMLQYNGTYLYV